jgi:hypothetical protein
VSSPHARQEYQPDGRSMCARSEAFVPHLPVWRLVPQVRDGLLRRVLQAPYQLQVMRAGNSDDAPAAKALPDPLASALQDVLTQLAARRQPLEPVLRRADCCHPASPSASQLEPDRRRGLQFRRQDTSQTYLYGTDLWLEDVSRAREMFRHSSCAHLTSGSIRTVT